ncbi:hypothetical protein NLU13_8551 [Sarocladium strictum]|uniref:Uncharacterized protein n=1 Tax=Sarocladium strictum TaxID=5046 RepID=A0AA39GBY5_SARSR|nr:hypothetical protein NLU13_8551 [Sarocladium strictum]
MRVTIIGAGPSGLVQLKTILEAHKRFPSRLPHFEVRLFESHDRVGGVFLHHSYEDGELVSSKYLTTFSDFRPRSDDPDFFSSQRYREYLEEYATHFGLWEHIHFGTKVESVRRGDGGVGHVVKYVTKEGVEEEWECDAIAVCSGVHHTPNYPDIPGIEHVPVVMHSEKFKERKQLGENTTVMILGSGETGADLAYLAITSPTKRAILCHKDGWIGAPKKLPNQHWLSPIFGLNTSTKPGLPLDVSQVTLFDTMYVHPMVRDSMAVWNFYHFLAIPFGCWLTTGTSRGMDQWVGQVPDSRFHASKVFFNKAWQRIQAAVSEPYRPKKLSLTSRIRRFFIHTDFPPPSRILDVAPFPSHITPDGVAHFPYNPSRPESARINEQGPVKPDVIIFATGYIPSFPFLQHADNEGGRPYPIAHDADVRQVWKRDDPTVGFIGFVRPGFGAIPPLAEMQSLLFTSNLLGLLPEDKPLDPEDEWHYRLIHRPDARVTYGVEHDSYAYQLAKDMGIAPTFTEILRLSLSTPRGWRLPYIWGAGACLNTKFRLVGPWKWDGAGEVMTGELWETVTRRTGAWGNLPLSGTPLLYLGTMNLYYWMYSGFWNGLARLGLSKPLKRVIAPKLMMEEMARAEQMKKVSGKDMDWENVSANGTA